MQVKVQYPLSLFQDFKTGFYSVAQTGHQLTIVLLLALVLGLQDCATKPGPSFLDQLERSREVFRLGGFSGQVSFDPRIKL